MQNFAELTYAPIFSEEAHPAIYRVTLTNQDGEEGAPGKAVCSGGEYAAAGDTVTLELS
jgi:hypothetical protein